MMSDVCHRNKWSQREFAKQVGISYQHTQDWKRKDRAAKINYQDAMKIIIAANPKEEDSPLDRLRNDMKRLDETVSELMNENMLLRKKPSTSQSNA